MIHSWPADTKAFYMKRDEINNNLAFRSRYDCARGLVVK